LRHEDDLQQKLDYAIIDEVDSILVDEARTPLIISGPAEESTQKYYQADKVARKLIKAVDYEVKEKEHSVILTEEGIEKAEKLVGVDSFYTGKNMDWPHLLEQSLKAHNLYNNDVAYVVEDSEIIIVDEFTGRKQPGRRWSDGLHQAIEAKEKLRIREENQTLATITFQNFFRLYKKISGMTGTAMTEAMEFDKIYNLGVVAMPTNKTLHRTNNNDRIYYDKKDKFKAISEEITRYHRTGRPILVGTISIENSEALSRMLTQSGIQHEVLNAKHHEREAQIVAKAGQLANVTIATNMAGRGTDIVLGSFELSDLVEHWKKLGAAPKNASGKESREDLEKKLFPFWGSLFLGQAEIEGKTPTEIYALLKTQWETLGHPPLLLATSVSELGGLHIVGTERHESRRIDNQLRGRCGRQGDPGSSRFFLSLEDDLMRIFANEWVAKMMQRAGLRDGQEVEHKMISNAIERAQKRVESHHFDIRKNLLEYDEVMDKQRKLIYEQRESILQKRDIKETVIGMIEAAIANVVDLYYSEEIHKEDRNLDEVIQFVDKRIALKISKEELANKSSEEVIQYLLQKAEESLQQKINIIGKEAMDELMCFLLLQSIDTKWKDHLYAMDVLRSGVGLEGMGGKDPKLEYK
ncbi:MAG: preprotein translocase subunit SecA, partial [Planctomycetota bacterium]